jgi:putative glutathione S-transferase
MAMLIEGVWREEEQIIKNGAFVRQVSVHNREIDIDVIEAIAVQPGRFWLIGSWSCPWSHRTMIIRQIKGLVDHIPLHITGGKRVQGYPADHGKLWKVPGCDQHISHLHQLYTLSNSKHTGRPTVPVLWDSQEQKIISDESSKIMRAFDAVTFSDSPDHEQNNFTLVPEHLRESIDSLNQVIYNKLSNGVYRACFAQTQRAYEEAVTQVFEILDQLEKRLTYNRFLFGEIVTEADWRLFASLVRFDLDYFMHSRCSIRRLVDYSNLWDYARDLFSFEGIAETINFEAIHLSNYQQNEVIAKMPIIDWRAVHHRNDLGKIKLAQ